MYINLKYLEEVGLIWKDIIVLQLAKQQKTENLEDHLKPFEETIEIFLSTGLLKKVKAKRKKDSELSRVRIDKPGMEILDNIEIPELLEEDITIFNWMKNIYLGKEKKLGNQKKTKMYIAFFRTQSGIDKNRLSYLISTFVADDSNMEYNFQLEYVFYKPINAYATRFQLDESRLYKYYLLHQEYFDAKFETL